MKCKLFAYPAEYTASPEQGLVFYQQKLYKLMYSVTGYKS